MNESEKLLEKYAGKNMFHWNQESFKITHSRLHKSIIEALNEALRTHDVSGMLCGSFDLCNKTSSATKCKCGREKWEHPKPRN